MLQSSQNAELDKKSLCSEMAEEMQFALRCHGSKKPARKKHSIIGITIPNSLFKPHPGVDHSCSRL